MLPTSFCSPSLWFLFSQPREGIKGGALLYFKSHIDCKRREDLETEMYKSCEGKINDICMYLQTSFCGIKRFFKLFIERLSTENKTIKN